MSRASVFEFAIVNGDSVCCNNSALVQGGCLAKLIDVCTRLGVSPHPAKFSKIFDERRVECNLCPRNCKIPDQLHGFCGVRYNDQGKLVTINYGASVEMTQEVIETEAVYHFAPGTPILSLGNVGCMMNCSYCHNWRTSQIKNVNRHDIHKYSPEEVVERALSKGIKILSWTYNDPVVWHEFVYDTAKLARQHGLINLYKSAFYISPQAIEELHDVIDIFSLSLKSMNPEFYNNITKGKLQPILNGIEQVYKYQKHHLEISNLVVTGMNDNLEDVRKISEWVLTKLDASVPLHFVRFHPDYKYNHVERTSIPFLKKARDYSKSLGIQNCYLGNVFEAGEWLNTTCSHCDSLLVKRFGMKTVVTGVNDDGLCENCDHPANLNGLQYIPQISQQQNKINSRRLPNKLQHLWCGEINAGHVTVINKSATEQELLYRHLGTEISQQLKLKPKEQYRFLLSRPTYESKGFEIKASDNIEVYFLETLDRAHFPVAEPSEMERAISHGHQNTNFTHAHLD